MEKLILQRIFFAVDTTPWQAIITEWQNLFRHQLSSFEHAVNWRPSESLHLTLLFLGELGLDKISLIHQCMQEFIFTESISLTGERIGILNQKYIVIFIKPTTLNLLQQQLIAQLQIAEISLHNEKSFVPHITLGKISNTIDEKEITDQLNQIDTHQLQPINVHQIGLYQSFPGNNYQLVKNFQLKSRKALL
jgi:2'-5' RNA ligase